MSRYTDIYQIESATQAIPNIGEIRERDTDLYITFNAADRLDMISYRAYGDPQYWWVILAANGYQIEFDIEEGEILRIPVPLAEVLAEMREYIDGES